MKDKTVGAPIKEFVRLKRIMYSLLLYNSSERKKAKGVNRNIVEK